MVGSRKRRDGGKGGAQLATTNNQIRIFRADPELPKILVVPQLPNQVVAQLLKKVLAVNSFMQLTNEEEKKT